MQCLALLRLHVIISRPKVRFSSCLIYLTDMQCKGAGEPCTQHKVVPTDPTVL
jgi:hypothetical protein